MSVLALHDGTETKAWLVGETAASTEQHIRNGYPHLLKAWQAGDVKASDVAAVTSERFESEFFEVRDQSIVRKSEDVVLAIKTARAEDMVVEKG